MSLVGKTVDLRPTRTADAILEWLQEQGIERIYGIPGGAVAPLFDALADASIELVMCQHEGMAGYLACGEALATGRPGIVLVTSGPGVLNTLTSVAAAFQDEIPLIVLAGEVRTDWSGRGALQDGGTSGLDVRSIFRSVTRFQDELSQPERVAHLLSAAWDAATTHPRGPALLRVPVDLCAGVSAVPEWRASVEPTAACPPALEGAARLLASAQRPALLAGVGARSAGLGPLLERLAYRMRMPILTDLEAKGVVSEADPLCLGLHGPGQGAAVSAYVEAGIDVLLTVGARLDDTATHGFSELLRPSRALIQLDHDPSRLHRAWHAELGFVGDLRAMCEALLEACAPLPPLELLRRHAQILDAREATPEVTHQMGGAPFDPHGVVIELQRLWGGDAIFLTDIGNHMLFTAHNLVVVRPGTFHASTGLAGMGSGIGAAMGMAASLGTETPVVCVCGDGGLLMVGNELATCARYGIPVILCVFDDGHFGMVEAGMEAVYGRSGTAILPSVSVSAFARSLGATVVDVARPADLRPPWDMEGPLVLRVPIDPTVRLANPRDAGFDAERSHG